MTAFYIPLGAHWSSGTESAVTAEYEGKRVFSKEAPPMFARFLEVVVENRQGFLNTIRDLSLPLLREQSGFLELLVCFPEINPDQAIVISLWKTKSDTDRFEQEAYPAVFDMMKPHARVTSVARYHVENSLCARFRDLLPTV